MGENVIPGRVKNKTATDVEWSQRNPLLLDGEFAVIKLPDGRRRIKVGDGIRNYNALPFFDESAGSYQGIATPTMVPNTSNGKVWYFGGPGVYQNFYDSGNNQISVNSELAVLSFQNGSWTKLELGGNTTYQETRLRVKTGGTPGVDCDYTTITAALTFAQTRAYYGNRHIVEVMPGTYVEAGQSSNGLRVPDYTDIVGRGPGEVIIRNVAAASAAAEEANSTILLLGNNKLKNLRIEGYRNRAALDSAPSLPFTAKRVIENCKFAHFGGQSTANEAMHVETLVSIYQNITTSFYNCQFLNRQVYIANQFALSTRNNAGQSTVIFDNCRMLRMRIEDALQYSDDKLQLVNSQIQILSIAAYLNIYTANPGNPTANRGLQPPLLKIVTSGNQIGSVVVDGDYTTISGGALPLFDDYNYLAYNNSVGAITQGYAVMRLASIPLQNTLSSNVLADVVAPYNGNGVFAGFAQANIAAGANGYVVRAKTNAIITAAFSNAGGSVVMGDSLELNASGQVRKRATGDRVGYALSADSGGLVVMLMV